MGWVQWLPLCDTSLTPLVFGVHPVVSYLQHNTLSGLKEALTPLEPTTSATFALEQLLEPFLTILAGFIAGLLLDFLLARRMQQHGSLTGWQADRVLGKSLRGMPIIWSTLAATYGVTVYAPFDPEQVQFWLRILLVPFILSITIFLMRLGVGLIDYSSEQRGALATNVSLSRSLIKGIVMTAGVLILLQTLGISITPIIAALGIGGLAVSLAMEETLSNVFSGLYIIISKQVQPGDYVRMKIDERDHIQGYITDITWRCTKIRMVPDRMVTEQTSVVTVPNSRMASDIVILHNRPGKECEMMLNIRIATGANLEDIERVTVEVAQEVLYDMLKVEQECRPVVRYRGFSPAYLDLLVVLYGHETIDQHLIRHELIKKLYHRYQQEGIAMLAMQATAENQPVLTENDATGATDP